MKYIILEKSRTFGAKDKKKRIRGGRIKEKLDEIKHLRWKASRVGSLRIRKLTLAALERAQEELERMEKSRVRSTDRRIL